MPAALKIFLWSFVAGITGGYVGLRFCFWIVERWFAHLPFAPVLAMVFTVAIGVSSAVTAGVLMGKRAR